MNVARTVAKNTAIIIAGQLASRVISALVGIYLVRYLGSEGYGQFSLVVAYLFFFRIVADLGIDTIVVREISKDKARGDELVGNALAMKLSLSVIAVAAAWLVLFFIGYSSDIKLYVHVASLAMLFSSGTLFAASFQAQLRMEYPVAVDIFTQLLSAGLTILLITLKASILAFFVLNVIISLANATLLFYLGRNWIQPSIRFNWALWKALLLASLPMTLQTIFVMIYMRIDQLLLFQVHGQQALGYYSAAVKLTELISIIPVAFMTSLFPLMSVYAAGSVTSFVKAYELSFKYLMMVAIPLAVGITLVSRDLVLFLYGSEFPPAAPALAILIWSEIVVFAGLVNNQILIATNQQRWALIPTSAIAVANVALCLWLIPRYSFVGASLATTVSYFVGPVLGYLIPAIRPCSVCMLRSAVKPIVASGAMALVLLYTSLDLLPAATLGAAVYVLTLVLLRGISWEDISLGKKALVGN